MHKRAERSIKVKDEENKQKEGSRKLAEVRKQSYGKKKKNTQNSGKDKISASMTINNFTGSGEVHGSRESV